MRKVANPISSTYERLEDVVDQQLNLSDAGDQSSKIDGASERRQYFRCSHQMGATDAVLFRKGMRQRREPVQLIDQSSSGFAVAYKGQESFEEGQVLMMQTHAGRHEVRVIYTLNGDDATRVGLERLRDNPEVSGDLSVGTLFLIVVFATMSVFTFALIGQ